MSKMRIVVIEDGDADLAILRYALNAAAAPYELLVLRDGEEAMGFVRGHRTGKLAPEPCLILLDLHLPKYDGMEVLREIVLHPPLSHIQVVAMSNWISPPQLAEIASLGAKFLEKPCSLEAYEALAREIVALCGQAHAASIS
jgi:chemotaxis family two-component system response regulator Rcp1